jgi:hypothetical protein
LALTKQLQLGELQVQLNDRLGHWQALSGISLVLGTVRKSYETERQPETLAEASAYLNKLTQARYQRIWTPFGESCLCVDDRDGQAVRVENLSRGTREQVYLSLRLALAAAYSRRGVPLPLILDDVFVNFDAQRARCAAETVCQFAAMGHQVLVFTCHDHIRNVFADLKVDVRELPDAQQHAQSPQPVLPATHVAPAAQQPRPTVTAPAGLPTEGDPELDYELMYGAPEYDPGYAGASEQAPDSPRPRRRRRRRVARSGVAPVDVPPAQAVSVPPMPDQHWGEVAEYAQWYPSNRLTTGWVS